MSMLKSPDQIAMMREAGRVVANALSAVREQAAVGVSLKELDDVAAAVISDAGGKACLPGLPPTLGGCAVPPRRHLYQCQRRVVHGIPPNGYVLEDGDLLSVDCGAFVEAGAVMPPSASS